jgi:multicomponent Na+:H+ antiporter subunit E
VGRQEAPFSLPNPHEGSGDERRGSHGCRSVAKVFEQPSTSGGLRHPARVLAAAFGPLRSPSSLARADLLSPRRFRKTRRFIAYVPWLIYQIVLANLHVAYLILRPGAIDPQVVRFKTKLKSEFSMVTLGNSITLTPGTITMDIVDGEFFVHALSKKVADDLRGGEMERRVAHVFLEDEDA